jgi:hypothetical protein
MSLSKHIGFQTKRVGKREKKSIDTKTFAMKPIRTNVRLANMSMHMHRGKVVFVRKTNLPCFEQKKRTKQRTKLMGAQNH